jgi:hypothetical protein
MVSFLTHILASIEFIVIVMRATYYKAKVFDDPENHWDRRAKTDELYVVLWHLYQVYDDSWKPREKDISKIPPKTVGVRFRFDVFSFQIDFFLCKNRYGMRKCECVSFMLREER